MFEVEFMKFIGNWMLLIDFDNTVHVLNSNSSIYSSSSMDRKTNKVVPSPPQMEYVFLNFE